MENMETENSYSEKDRYRNYYEGYTLLNFHTSGYVQGEYYVQQKKTLSKPYGYLKTPWYGDNFEDNIFEYFVLCKYSFEYGKELISTVNRLRNKGGLFFVLHFHIDIGLYEEGQEDVYISEIESGRNVNTLLKHLRIILKG